MLSVGSKISFINPNMLRGIGIVLKNPRRYLDIDPACAGMERSCPRDSKNVSFVDVGLV